jgi:hypothetical protein
MNHTRNINKRRRINKEIDGKKRKEADGKKKKEGEPKKKFA